MASITYTPDAGFAGTAAFGYTVCDDGTTNAVARSVVHETGTVTVNFTAPNQPPVGDPATASTAEDTAVPITLTGSDPDGDPITFAVASAPVHGTLSGTAPALTYTPAADYFGPDSFTFTVFDGQATSVPATVTITVTEVNDPPVAGADSVTAPGGRPFGVSTTSLLANDTAGPSNEAAQTDSSFDAEAGANTHGTVTMSRGTITYIPDVGFSGPASFTYTVCDNGTTNAQPDPRCADGIVSATVTVAPNQQPVGVPATVAAVEDTAVSFTLDGSDDDGDPITFAVASSPTHGTLSGTAPALTYTPAADYFGPDSFTFTVFDGQATSVPATVTITVSRGERSAGRRRRQRHRAGRCAVRRRPPRRCWPTTPRGRPTRPARCCAVTAVTAGADTHGTVTLADGTITYTPERRVHGSGVVHVHGVRQRHHQRPRRPEVHEHRHGHRQPRRPQPTTRRQPPEPHRRRGPHVVDHADRIGSRGRPDHVLDRHTSRARDADRHRAGARLHPGRRTTSDPTRSRSRPTTAFSSSPPATVSITVTEVNDPPVLGADFFTLGGAGTLPPPPPQPSCGTPCGVIFGDPHLLTLRSRRLRRAGGRRGHRGQVDDRRLRAAGPLRGGARRRGSCRSPSASACASPAIACRMYRTLDRAWTTRIDGTPVTVPANPLTLPGGGTIGTYGSTDTVTVVWPDGSVAIVRAVGVYPEYYRFTVELGLAAGRLGHVVGLLGNADGVDRRRPRHPRRSSRSPIPNTPFAELYGTHINSWRISQAESLLDYGPGQTTDDVHRPDVPGRPGDAADPPGRGRAAARPDCAPSSA